VDLSVVSYHVTSHFFAVEPEPQRSHRLVWPAERHQSPVIQMGLFLDGAGTPAYYRLFDGRIPGVTALDPILKEFKDSYAPGRIIFVANQAMNTVSNTAYLADAGDGWAFSGSLRNAAKAIQTWALADDGWQWNADHSARTKSKVRTRYITALGGMGTPFKRGIKEKVIVRWSAANASRDAMNRGAKHYAKAERVEGMIRGGGPVGHPDFTAEAARAAADSRLDGYWVIYTSEADTPDDEVIAGNLRLSQAEEALRDTTTDLEARPVYLRTPREVQALFLIRYLALVIVDLIKKGLAPGIPSDQVVAALRDMTAHHVGDGVYLLTRPPLWDTIDQATSAPLDQKWATVAELRAWRRALQRGVDRLVAKHPA
jgi:hypothetical protein